MAVNMDGTCMQGLKLLFYQGSTVILHSDMMWHSFSCSCRVLWVSSVTNVKPWKKTSNLNATIRLQAQSWCLVNCVMHTLKRWASPQLFKDSIRHWSHADLRNSILYLFPVIHFQKENRLQYFSGVLSGVQQKNLFAVIQFYTKLIACSNHFTLSWT